MLRVEYYIFVGIAYNISSIANYNVCLVVRGNVCLVLATTMKIKQRRMMNVDTKSSRVGDV